MWCFGGSKAAVVLEGEFWCERYVSLSVCVRACTDAMGSQRVLCPLPCVCYVMLSRDLCEEAVCDN